MKDSLTQKLTRYSKTKIPFHMPGHKRVFKNSPIPYHIDITEVDGFDNLHDPSGVIKETADLAKELYSSVEAYPLVGGSTCGILAGIYSLTRDNKNILIARNCHKSVYNAAEILDLNVHYVLPEMYDNGIWGAVSAEKIEELIKLNNIGTIVITSPTYDGVISDIPAVFEVCKRNGAYLLVDCAHGAHLFDLHKICDICVMSLHKTLPSLTQTAVLNVFSDRVDTALVRHGLSIFETSSPSYILLASIDECLRYMLDSRDACSKLLNNLEVFYEKTKTLKNLIVTHFDDPGKIIIFTHDSKSLEDLLSEEKIEIEMSSTNYVLLIATVCDTKRTLNTLLSALIKIDKKIGGKHEKKEREFVLPKKALSVKDAILKSGELRDIHDSLGKISSEYVWAYPPGAPVLVPGEVITKEVVDYLDGIEDLKSTKGKYPKIYTL